MGLDDAGCLVVFALIVSFIPIFIGLYYLIKIRKIKKIKARKIGKLVPGKVEINGRAYPFPGKELRSPMGNHECVRYLTKVYSKRIEDSGAIKQTVEVTRWKEEKGARFLLKDETGSVRLKVQYDEFPMKKVFIEHIDPIYPPSDLVKDFCRRKNIDEKGPFGFLNRDLYLKESILPFGQEMYILGEAERVPIDRELTTIKGISPYEINLNLDSIVSFEGEMDVIKKYKTIAIGTIIFGAAMILISFAILLGALFL